MQEFDLEIYQANANAKLLSFFGLLLCQDLVQIKMRNL